MGTGEKRRLQPSTTTFPGDSSPSNESTTENSSATTSTTTLTTAHSSGNSTTTLTTAHSSGNSTTSSFLSTTAEPSAPMSGATSRHAILMLVFTTVVTPLGYLYSS